MHICLCTPGDLGGQKRVQDLVELELQTTTSQPVILEIKLGPLEQQLVLLTAGQSL